MRDFSLRVDGALSGHGDQLVISFNRHNAIIGLSNSVYTLHDWKSLFTHYDIFIVYISKLLQFVCSGFISLKNED